MGLHLVSGALGNKRQQFRPFDVKTTGIRGAEAFGCHLPEVGRIHDVASVGPDGLPHDADR